MKKRVVVTGIGTVTSIGNNVEEMWNSIKLGKHGFAPITYFDCSNFKCSLAAEVKNFQPREVLPNRLVARTEKFVQFGLVAAKEAIESSRLDIKSEDAYRIGCVIGSGVGSLQAIEREHEKLLGCGPNRISPFLVPMHVSNMASANISILFGIKGKSYCISSACASGANAIGEAFRTIQYGDADVMITGGAESVITPLGIGGFDALNALSISKDPDHCCIPFDRDRNGFVMGEGAGILVIEELEHAKKRCAPIYAELVGYGFTSDAYHITKPEISGISIAESMKMAIKDAGVELTDIEYINAHGTGTYYNDFVETKAIKTLFGEHSKNLYVNSTKSIIGHMIGASGPVESIVCIKEIEEGYIHPTLKYNCSEEEMNLNYCKTEVKKDIKYALSNSLGFGGHNVSLVVKRFTEE